MALGLNSSAGCRGGRAPLRAAVWEWMVLRDEAPCGVPGARVNTSPCVQKAIRKRHTGMEGSHVLSNTGPPCTAQETARANDVEFKVGRLFWVKLEGTFVSGPSNLSGVSLLTDLNMNQTRGAVARPYSTIRHIMWQNWSGAQGRRREVVGKSADENNLIYEEHPTLQPGPVSANLEDGRPWGLCDLSTPVCHGVLAVSVALESKWGSPEATPKARILQWGDALCEDGGKRPTV